MIQRTAQPGDPAPRPTAQGQPGTQTQPFPEQFGPPLPEQFRAPRRWPPRLLPRVPRWAKWTAVILLVGLVFRRVVAWAVLAALSAALHLVGVNAHLPHISFGWPWQST